MAQENVRHLEVWGKWYFDIEYLSIRFLPCFNFPFPVHHCIFLLGKNSRMVFHPRCSDVNARLICSLNSFIPLGILVVRQEFLPYNSSGSLILLSEKNMKCVSI